MRIPFFATTLLMTLLAICSAPDASADGPKDNDPHQVRPVPKVGIEVADTDRQELEAGLSKLGALLDQLRPKGTIETTGELRAWDCYADVAIFHRAVRVALQDQEFFDPKEVVAAKKLLETGLERAQQLKASELPWVAPWQSQTGLVVRGYISHIDHTPQPYGLVIPETFSVDQSQGTRIDLWFHGRGETLSEVNFLTQRMTSVGQISPPDTIVLHPYGRYCNANKFAGEIDTLEALAAVRRNYGLEQTPVAARGFSMGGAACWQFAVHYPALWFAANPGAGFSETPEFLKFFQHETLTPPWWEEKLWRWYDCPGYVANLKSLPVVAYSGENDIQKQAADIMAAAYEQAGMKLLHLIGPKTGHSIHPDSAKEIESKLAAWRAAVGESQPLGRDEFVTYSLIYPQFRSGRILGLQEHWEPAHLTAQVSPTGEIDVTTRNITVFHLAAPHLTGKQESALKHGIRIDGQLLNENSLNAPVSQHLGYALIDGVWKPTTHQSRLELTANKKNDATCGPIDHAFMTSFIFVKPTGRCAHPAVQQWVEAEMDRAITQWRRQFRGDVRVMLDSEITEADVRSSHEELRSANLILWGDRQSNRWIAKFADQLPIRWTDTEIAAGDQTFDAAQHALIAIYPNPLNRSRYIVLNSGFTYREYDYLNNARQTPKLPDWAIVDLRTPPNSRWPGKIIAADFFDEAWRLKPARNIAP
ncbi:MAG: prolyl oligopeptidase family serine peptidase [Planctomycetaceae bacterium]